MSLVDKKHDSSGNNPFICLFPKIKSYVQELYNNTPPSFVQSTSISCDDFTNYLLFNAVEMDIKEVQSREDTISLHDRTKQAHDAYDQSSQTDPKNSMLVGDIETVYKRLTREHEARIKYTQASYSRHNFSQESIKAKGLHTVNSRSENRKGYPITSIQWYQLMDKDYLQIKKRPELRQFIDSNHVKNDRIHKYYSNLFEYAQVGRCADTAKERVIRAINANDFEHLNGSLLFYQIAKQYSQADVQDLDDDLLDPITYLTEPILDLKNGTITRIYQKPVLYMPNLISAVVNCQIDVLTWYRALLCFGDDIRTQQLVPLLAETEYTYEDVDEYFLDNQHYNPFDAYIEPSWKYKGTESMLRSLIKHFTVDPLATEF